jgi:DNA-binding NarL/FixJ family response regulator
MPQFTKMETQILTLVALGFTNPQIADYYQRSVFTVRDHVCNLLYKLGVSNRTQIAIYAWDTGLVCPRDAWKIVRAMLAASDPPISKAK